MSALAPKHLCCQWYNKHCKTDEFFRESMVKKGKKLCCPWDVIPTTLRQKWLLEWLWGRCLSCNYTSAWLDLTRLGSSSCCIELGSRAERSVILSTGGSTWVEVQVEETWVRKHWEPAENSIRERTIDYDYRVNAMCVFTKYFSWLLGTQATFVGPLPLGGGHMTSSA